MDPTQQEEGSNNTNPTELEHAVQVDEDLETSTSEQQQQQQQMEASKAGCSSRSHPSQEMEVDIEEHHNEKLTGGPDPSLPVRDHQDLPLLEAVKPLTSQNIHQKADLLNQNNLQEDQHEIQPTKSLSCEQENIEDASLVQSLPETTIEMSLPDVQVPDVIHTGESHKQDELESSSVEEKRDKQGQLEVLALTVQDQPGALSLGMNLVRKESEIGPTGLNTEMKEPEVSLVEVKGKQEEESISPMEISDRNQETLQESPAKVNGCQSQTVLTMDTVCSETDLFVKEKGVKRELERDVNIGEVKVETDSFSKENGVKRELEREDVNIIEVKAETKATGNCGEEKNKPDQSKNTEQPNKQKANPDNKNQGKPKQEQQTKKQKSAFVGENYERINYLVQASHAMVSMGESMGETDSLEFDRALASQTGSLATSVGRRCLIRLEPALKRMLCKGCGISLIYGVNARVRHKSKRKHLVITCLTCHTIKRLPVNQDYKLWCEQEEALA